MAEQLTGLADDRALLGRTSTAERVSDILRSRIAEGYFPPGTRLRLPPGGLNLWVELPERASAVTLFERALREGIRIAPGTMFSNTDRYDRFVRFGCTLPFTEAVEDAYRTLGTLVREMLPT